MKCRAILVLWLVAETVRAQDAAHGEKIFAACSVCHDTGSENKQGPGLAQIVGRKAGSAAGFRYSGAMKRSKIVWDGAALDGYLADPPAFLPGNTMPFPGLPDATQRRDLIAYLKTLK